MILFLYSLSKTIEYMSGFRLSKQVRGAAAVRAIPIALKDLVFLSALFFSQMNSTIEFRGE